MKIATTLALLVLVTPAIADDRVIVLDYPGFRIWHDCVLGGPLAAHYEIKEDTGTLDRDHDFHLDPGLPDGCAQQKSTEPYPSPNGAEKYDRGHLVPANHLDDRQEAISASNVMTNITPQQSSFNRTGAWRETEKRIECWRDREPLSIWIGVLWGDDTSNDFVVGSHGIPTPDAFVKLVVNTTTGSAIAWKLENTRLKAGELDTHAIAPDKARVLLEALTGPQEAYTHLPTTTDPAEWPKLTCDQG